MKGLLFVDFKIYKVYFIVLNINSVCSIRHDFYGGCRDSAEGGVLLSCLNYMERLSVCIYRIYEKLSSLSKNRLCNEFSVKSQRVPERGGS